MNKNKNYTTCLVKIPIRDYKRFQNVEKKEEESIQDVVIRLALERLNQIRTEF